MAFVINNVTLVGGRLVRDAEMSYTSSTGNARMTFDLAINHSYRDKKTDQFVDQPNFFKVVLWGKPAESLQNFMKKGTQIAVEGRLSQRKWQRDDGTNTSIVEIVANNVILMGGRSADSGAQTAPPAGNDYNKNMSQQNPPMAAQPGQGFNNQNNAAQPDQGFNNQSNHDEINYETPLGEGEDGEYPPF